MRCGIKLRWHSKYYYHQIFQESIPMGCCTPSQQKQYKELRVKIYQSLHKTDIFQHEENPEIKMKKTMDITDFIFFSLRIELEQKMQQEYLQFQKKSRISKDKTAQQFMDIYSSNMKEIVNKIRANRQKNGQQLAADWKQLENSKVKINSKLSLDKNDKNKINYNPALPNEQGSSQVAHPQKMVKEDRSNSQSSHKTSKSRQSSFFNLERLSSNSYNYPKQTEELSMQERKCLEQIQMNSIHKTEKTQASIQRINELEQTVIQLKEQRQINQESIREISFEKEELQKKIPSLEKTIASQKQLIQSLEKDIESLHKSLKERDEKCREHQYKNIDLEITKEKLKEQIEKLEKQRDRVVVDPQVELIDSIAQNQNNNKVIQSEYDEANKISIATETGGSFLEVPTPTKLPTTPNITPEHSKQIQKYKESYEIILKFFANSTLLPTFLELHKATQSRLQISKLFQKQLIGTKLLFRFDQISKLHFDEYISLESNIILLIKTKKDHIIGGFMGQVSQNDDVSTSFLFRLKEDRDPIKLTTKNEVKKINFDPNYLNFGTGQLKIKARTLTLDSNISGFQCQYYLNGRGITRQQFLGYQENKASIQGYEIHKLYFRS